jgi:hypothetical protein
VLEFTLTLGTIENPLGHIALSRVPPDRLESATVR